MQIFAEVPWRGASNDSELNGLSRTAIFSVFAGYFSGNVRDEASVFYIAIRSPSSAFQ